MNSREKILQAVKQNQPEPVSLPHIPFFTPPFTNLEQKFTKVLQSIGGEVHRVSSYAEINQILKKEFGSKTIFSSAQELAELMDTGLDYKNAHAFADLELAVVEANLAVAENSAIWVTEAMVQERALPFIAQHLALIIQPQNLVATMHEAYARIADADYGFATFIAGPSKTADIEQSLVLGAHGPKSLLVFLLDREIA
ncbi:LUD domain-containing protein [Adhaeribacter swui]|uniref:LUD domain-containing protein n=1 Tax=Adhaeribacter swui TaxID=2086471 RepID=A0A7G7GBA6_9BACT|nr:LUD domain-containing protein [Adhaeribacter swui]QNF34440.1 LUD domain-containing protein [Adhaeribacter swui]